MRTPGQTTDSPDFGAVRGISSQDREEVKDLPCYGDITVTNAYMGANSWYDRDNPGRPYMHLVGECDSIRGDMPYGVSELTFENTKGIPVDFIYEFTNDELANLVQKGLYSRGFACPDILYQSVMEMPITCDLTVVRPQMSGDIPIIFADIKNKEHILTNSEQSQYDITSYFEEPRQMSADDDYGFNDIQLDSDDMFNNRQQAAEQVEQAQPERSAEDKALDALYARVRERVMKEHILPEQHKLAKSKEDTVDDVLDFDAEEVKESQADVDARVAENKAEAERKAAEEDAKRLAAAKAAEESLKEAEAKAQALKDLGTKDYSSLSVPEMPEVPSITTTSLSLPKIEAKTYEKRFEEGVESSSKFDQLVKDIVYADELSDKPLLDENKDFVTRCIEMSQLLTNDPQKVVDDLKGVVKREPLVEDTLNKARIIRDQARAMEAHAVQEQEARKAAAKGIDLDPNDDVEVEKPKPKAEVKAVAEPVAEPKVEAVAPKVLEEPKAEEVHEEVQKPIERDVEETQQIVDEPKNTPVRRQVPSHLEDIAEQSDEYDDDQDFEDALGN
jgi:hypothetical protein